MAGEPLQLPGQIGEDPLSAVARMRTQAAGPGVDLGAVRLEDLPKRNGQRLGSITPEQLATIQLDTGLQGIGFPTTPAGMLEGLPAATPFDRIPAPEPPSPVGNRVTAGMAAKAPQPFNEPAPPNEGAYQVLNKRRGDMMKRRAIEDSDATWEALRNRLTPTEPIEGETPVYLRRLYQPTVDRVKQLWYLPEHVEVSRLAGEIVEAEASYRLQNGLYGPEEAHVETFEQWAASIPPNLVQQMQADGTLDRHRFRKFVNAKTLKHNISEELGGGLPMYAPEAASRQDKLYTLVKDLTPEELPAARGMLEKLAQTAGDIAPFLAEIAIARRAIGLPIAKMTGRAVATGAGLESGLALGLAAGAVAATRKDMDPVTEGAFFGALGGIHRLAPGTSKAAAVVRTGATGAAFATKTAFEGGNLEDILISGLIVPLLFHAPDLIRRPWRPRTVLTRDPEAWRKWGDDASQVKKMIHRFNLMGEQADTLSPETWNRELTQTATALGKMYERAQKTPERFKGEELDLLQQFVNRFSEKPAAPTPTEELRTYELNLGSERGTRQVQAGSAQEADHLGRGIAGVEYRQPREGQHKPLAEEPSAGPGTEVFRVEVSDGRRRIITARDQAEADGMAQSVFGVEVTAVIPTKQPVEEAQGLSVATAAPLTPPAVPAESVATAPPEPLIGPAIEPKADVLLTEQPEIEPTVDKPAGSEAAVDSIGGAGIAGPPRDTAGAMGKPLREYEGARYNVVGAEGQGWKVTDKGTGETVQVVASQEIADIIAREYNAIETGVEAAAAPLEKPKIPETIPTTITVPAAGEIPGYRITRWPNGVHVVRFDNKPSAEVLERIKNQGGRWHKKSKGHLMPSTFSTSQIQGVIHGTVTPPKSVDLPTPTETKGTATLTPLQAGELLGIGDNRKLVRESLQARGYGHTAGSKNEFFEHPSGEFRYRMQPRNIRKQVRGPEGKGWVTTTRVFTIKEMGASIRRALTEIQQKAPMTKRPAERSPKERTKEIAELRDYIAALGKRIASRTNSFGDPLADIQVQQIEELRTAAEDRFGELMRQAGKRPPAVQAAPVEPTPPTPPADKADTTDTIPAESLAELSTTGAPTDRRIQKLRADADRIETKVAEMRGRYPDRPTRKRLNEWEQKSRDANNLEDLGTWMRAMANAIEKGELPGVLDPVAHKATLEDLRSHSSPSMSTFLFAKDVREAIKGQKGASEVRALLQRVEGSRRDNTIRMVDKATTEALAQMAALLKKMSPKGSDNGPKIAKNMAGDIAQAKRWYKMVEQLGLEPTADNLEMVYAEQRLALEKMIEAEKEGRRAERDTAAAIRKSDQELHGQKIPGFFPTPDAVTRAALDKVGEDVGGVAPATVTRMLEPSAGRGDMAKAMRAELPEVPMTVVEVRPQLADRIREEAISKTTVMQADFLEWSPSLDRTPNLIVMNPPFEKGEDMDHVRHAYDILAPRGQLLAVMSSGSFSRSDKKATGFREWLQSVPSAWEDLPEGSFKAAFKGTGVTTKLVNIVKPGGPEPEAKPEPTVAEPEKPLAVAAKKLTEAAGALVEAAEGKETRKPSKPAPNDRAAKMTEAVDAVQTALEDAVHIKDSASFRRQMVTLLRRAKEAVDGVKYDLVDTIPEPSGEDAHREINGSVGHQASQEEVGAVLEEAFNESTNLAADVWAATKALDEGTHPSTGKPIKKGDYAGLRDRMYREWVRLSDQISEVSRLFGWRAASDYEVLVWADQSLPIASAIQQGAQRVKSDHETTLAEREGGPEAIDDADLPDPNLRATGGVRDPAVDQLIKQTDQVAYEVVKAKLLKQGKAGAEAIKHLGVGHADAAEARLVIKAIEAGDRETGIRYPVSVGDVTLPADLAGELPPRIATALETARRAYGDRLEEVETGVEGAKLWLLAPDSPKSKKILAEFKKSQGKPGVGLGGKPRRPDTFKGKAPSPGLPKSRREPLVAIQDARMTEPGRYVDLNGVLVTAGGVFASEGRVIFNAIDIPAGLEAGHVYKLDAKGKVEGKPIRVSKGSQKGKAHAGEPWLATNEKDEEYSSFPDLTEQFVSVGPEQVFEIEPDQVAAVAKRLQQANDFKDPAEVPEIAGVIGVLNPDGSLGFATAIPEVGSAELNVQEDGVVLGGVAAELLRKALRFHYDVSPGSPIQVYWPEPPADPKKTQLPIRMVSNKARTVVMPVSTSPQNARVEKLMRPGLYQEDLDRIRVGFESYAQTGFLPAFYHSETGDVAKSSVSNSWQLEGLPESMMRAADRADLAVQPGFVDKDGKFYPLADAWVGAVDQMKLPALVKAAGLDPGSLTADEADHIPGLRKKEAPQPTGFKAEDQSHREALGKVIDSLDEYRQAEGVAGGEAGVRRNEWHDADDALRKLIGHRPRVAGGADLFEFERAKYVAARLLRLKLAKRGAVKVRGTDPDLMPQLTAKMTPEDLAYLREHGPSSPVFGMGAAPNIPDQRYWHARLYDHISNRLQHPPPGTIRDHVTKIFGRGLYNYRWALTDEEFRKFEKVKGEKRWGRGISRKIKGKIREGVSERIKTAESKRDRPLTAPQADTLRKRYHREVEDVLRGDRPFDQLDDRQKEIWKLYIRPTRYVTDYILNNEWTWPHLQAFGLKNIEEVIMIKSVGPGEYLRRLYEQTDKPFEPPPDLLEKRVVNIGPRIRGGQFLPRRGDEEFTTLVDTTHSPPQQQQFMDPKQARAELERLIKENIEEYGKSVFNKIMVLDPYNVEELEQAGILRPVRDVEVLIQSTIVESLANLETLKLFQYLANAVSIPIGGALPAGYRDVPDLPAYGPLRGTAVPEPTFYALMQRESIPAHPAHQAWRIYLSAWKKSKVVYSPSTHGRNILGVTAFVYLDGNNPIKHFPLLLQALREFRTGGPNWERLVRDNEINDGWSGKQLEDLERYVVANVDSWPEAVMLWLDKHKDVAATSVRRLEGISELDRIIGQAYDLPDQVSKLWAYLIKTQTQGMSHEESLRSMWMYHNYDRAGTFANWARHSPIGEPFVMFSEQTIKIYTRALRDRAIRMLALFASMPLLTYLSRLALGVGDEEMDLINADPRRSKSWPDRFFQPLIPLRNERGLPLSVDLRWTFPLGDDFRLGNATGGWEIPFLTGQPFVSAAAEIAFNRRNWSDRALVDPDAEWYTKLWQWAVHFIDSTLPVPPLVPMPGIDRGRVKWHGGALKIFLAATGQSREGVVTAVLREVVGIRVNDPWVRRADAFQLIKDARGAGEAERYAEMMTLYNELFRGEYDKPIKPRAVRRANKRDRNRNRNR